jgi:hypothetical protein
VGTGSGLTGGPITGAGTISVATGGVSTTHLANGAVTAAKLASNGCATDQIMKWNGSAWACANLPASTAIECPGPVISGTCLLKYDNIANINFQTAAQVCANLGGDLCTDSQSWPLTLGWWQNQYIGPTVVIRPHWTASFADNDNGYWTGSNGGTGDDHSANTGYGYACCGGARPPHPRVPIVTSASGVRYTALHDVNDTTFAGATAYCSALNSDICSDSQTFLLRKDSLLTQRSWTNSHADNDASGYNAINGGTSDDTHPSHESGFACCPSLRPVDLSCPVTRTSAVCATFIYNTANRTFDEAASDCAVRGADLCSTGQSAVLRVAGSLTVNKVWTNSHSDNDSSNASIGVGASMPDNPNLTTDLSGYACCLN